MTTRFLYVLSGYAGEAVPPADPDRPRFEYQHFVEQTGADVVSLDSLGGGAARRLPLSVQRMRLGLLVARRACRYDALIASGEDIGVFVALALRLLGRSTRLVIVTHGPQFGSAKFRLVLDRIKGMPNVVFACLSRSLATRIAARHGIDPRRCPPVGYGVDTRFYAGDPPAAGAPLIASAGSSNRDYDTLIRAVAELDVPVAIAANSTWVGRTATIRETPPAHVAFRSLGGYRELRDLYRQARVVVVPTHDVDYASGLAVIAEALACGTPVIASRGRVTSDFVVDGVNGWLVPPGDAAALRARIDEVLADPDRARAMGAAGTRMMAEEFSLDRYVAKLRAVATEPL